MKTRANAATKSSKKGASFYRNAFALTLLAAVLCAALMSWSSSRTLSFSLGGTWHSASGEGLVVVCSGGSAWASTCTLNSSQTQFEGPIRASPLTSGGWVASLESNPSGLSILWHRGKTLTLLTEQGGDSVKKVVYTRDEALAEDFMSVVRMKGKYIVALFLIVGTYKWVQVSLFGAPVRRLRRF